MTDYAAANDYLEHTFIADFNRLLDRPARVVPALKKLAAAGNVFRRTA